MEALKTSIEQNKKSTDYSLYRYYYQDEDNLFLYIGM